MASYEYDQFLPGMYWGRAAKADPAHHVKRTRELQYYQGPESFSRLIDDHPDYITSPSGGLIHRVEFVVHSYAQNSYGHSVTYWLVCGQMRSEDRCIPVSDPSEICHRCHDRHWLKTGEHLPALPQSGCELTRGTAYVSDRTHAIRTLVAHQNGS